MYALQHFASWYIEKRVLGDKSLDFCKNPEGTIYFMEIYANVVPPGYEMPGGYMPPELLRLLKK